MITKRFPARCWRKIKLEAAFITTQFVNRKTDDYRDGDGADDVDRNCNHRDDSNLHSPAGSAASNLFRYADYENFEFNFE